jgi:hypothetical protein
LLVTVSLLNGETLRGESVVEMQSSDPSDVAKRAAAELVKLASKKD